MKSANSADFVIVQSAWGMTQGFVMPLSGFLITAIGEKVFFKRRKLPFGMDAWANIFVVKSLPETDLVLEIKVIEGNQE